MATMSEPAPHTPGRVIDLDVVRAVALIGVCVMNYHGSVSYTHLTLPTSDLA